MSPFSARLRNTHCMDIRYEKYMLHKIELKKVDHMRLSQFHIPDFPGRVLGGKTDKTPEERQSFRYE